MILPYLMNYSTYKNVFYQFKIQHFITKGFNSSESPKVDALASKLY